MTRRLVVLLLAVAGLVGGGAHQVLAETADDAEEEQGADWACVYVDQLDSGYCQQNPLPPELPTPPEIPST